MIFLKKLIVMGVVLMASSAWAESVIIKGEIMDYSSSARFIAVKSHVMGITGPEERQDVLLFDEKTSVRLCWNGECMKGNAVKELARLKDFNYFEAEELSILGRDVEVEVTAGEMQAADSINIYSPIPAYYFTAVDFISPF